MPSFLFSCDHATCAVPEAFREVFRGSEDVVASPEGWEPGALNLAQGFAMKFRTPLVHGDVTRLLINLENNKEDRWSRFSQKLPEITRGKLVDRHERPYRALLHQRIEEDLRRHPALLHVMVHTDAPGEGTVRLETRPESALAESYADAWRQRLATADLDIRHVPAVEGSALGAILSGSFPTAKYAQIRLKVAQSFFLAGQPWRWETVKKLLLDSLAAAADEVDTIRKRL
ncbi:MAG: hypothetical protein H7246_06440 [Phycisphaerae bacterium]|nr:hypothetical protein [Saprospiraceae bacterium]